jgi:hypothetical protein
MLRNAQKTPLAISLGNATQSKIQDAVSLLGKTLPAEVVSVNGAIVTVSLLIRSSFTLPQITVPLAGSEYFRAPIQPGCTGIVLPASVYIGGVTGLGGGVADSSLPGNLSALVFLPLGSKNFSTTDDPNAAVVYGPDGSIIRTADKSSAVTVNASGTTIKVPLGKTLTIASLPTSPPVTSGGLWNSGGQVMVVP